MTNRLVIFLLFKLVSVFSIAQELSYKVYTTEDGLPSNEIYNLIIDKKGYLWGVSDGGVFRYDGENFKVFNTDNGLPDNTIFNIYEDPIGRLWMNGQNNKLGYLENDKFTLLPISSKLKDYVKGSVISNLKVDKELNLWLCSNFGFINIPKKGNYNSIAPHYNDISPSCLILKELSSGSLLACKSYHVPDPGKIDKLNSELIFLDKKDSAKLYKSTNTFNLAWTKMQTIKLFSGQKLITMNDDLYVLDSTLWLKKKFNCRISNLLETHEGLWISTTNSGVYFYKNSNLNVPPVVYLKEYYVMSMIEDREGGIWFSTSGKGLLHCSSTNLINYSNIPELKENIIAMTGNGSTTYCMNEKNTILGIEPDGIKTVYSGQPNSISGKARLRIQGDKLLFGAFRSGLVDLKNNAIEYFLDGKKYNIASTDIISTDKNAYLTTSFSRLIFFGKNQPCFDILFSSRVLSLFDNGNKDIWITSIGGLYSYKNKLILPINDRKGLLRSRINNVTEYKNYKLISTNENGLLIYKDSLHDPLQFTKKEGLLDNLCNSAVGDKNKIFIGSKKGLSIISFTNKTLRDFNIYHFTSQTGLPSNEVNCLLTVGNAIYIGTRKGLCKIVDVSKLVNLVKPDFYLENIFVNQAKVNSYQINDLTYQQNNIAFKLSNLSYRNRGNKRFLLRLYGYDEAFKYSKNSTIEYPNLPPGKYEFVAYALNDSEILSKPIKLSITIHPPFWKRLWFVLIMIFILATGVYTFVVLRVRSIRKRLKEKSELQQKLTEFELKALRSQMQPHFIFNSLNSIQHYVMQNKKEKASFYLAKFSKLIRSILENSKEDKILLEKEISMLEDYIILEQMRSNNKFEFTINIAPDLNKASVYIPTMLIQPLIENAIVHGVNPLINKIGLITIQLNRYKNDFLVCIVTDNGIGREASDKLKKKKEQYHQSLGVMISKERIGFYNYLKNEKTTFDIIDLISKDGSPEGTKVILILPLL